MIYLLTAIGLSPGGRSTVHIYTQTIHRTIQNKQYIEQGGISSLFYFYNYCSEFSFVDFIVIFNLIMLKFYFFFCLFFGNLICLLECLLYLILYSNYCVISKLCLFIMFIIMFLALPRR